MIRATLCVLITLIFLAPCAVAQQPAPAAVPPAPGATQQPAPAPVQPVSADSQNKIQDVNALLAQPEDAENTSAVPASTTRRERSTLDLFMQSATALCIVLALILGASWALRRFGRHTPLLAGTELATVLGRVHLAPRATLHFVRVDDKVLVIGLTSNHMTLITELEAIAAPDSDEIRDDGEPSAPASSAGAFSRQLQRNLERTSGKPQEYDAEIASLRSDLHRLQESLKGQSGDTE